MNSMLIVICCILIVSVAADSWNFAGVNIALGKNTTQSPDTYSRFTSDLAVDGNTNHVLTDGSCSHTSGYLNTKASWTVHLNESYILKGIRIFNRLNYRWRLRNFMIIGHPNSTVLYDDGTVKPELYNELQINITIDSVEQFSAITIEVPRNSINKSYVQLCEVQIYSENHDCPLPSPGDNLLTEIRTGTGYENSLKQLVSTWTSFDFTCDGLYTLMGNVAMTCLPGGDYNATTPTCEIKCNKPSNVTNGNYKQTLHDRYSLGESVTWECWSGYTSEQNHTRQCLESTYWSGDQPNCTHITCLFPDELVGGSFEFENNSDYTFGKVGIGFAVNVICAKGYNVNASRITCTENGQWDSLPQCIPVLCSRPAILNGGYYTYMTNGNSEANDKDVYEYGTVATAVCNGTLYRLSTDDDTSRTCGPDGTWTGHGNLCDALCEAPSLLNGYFQYQTETKFYETGQSLKLVCADGFELDNQTQYTIQCQQNHTWEPPVPNCTAVTGGDTARSTNIPAAVGGGVSAAVLVLAAVVIVMFVVIRRRRTHENCKDTMSKAETLTVPAFPNGIYKEATIYENNIDTIYDNQNNYENITDSHKIPENAITLEILADLVLTPTSATERFQKEFEAFQEGMTKQYTKASLNMHRNRYRGLYAYDDTRVVLDIWDEGNDSDYINACYIHGFSEPRAYIASQGPVEEILNDFWRMIWQNNCGKIVMLTNLMEDGKIKCKQYWPTSGTETYGRVVVTLTNTEHFVNFVIRTLDVSKGEKQRQVIQFHFTAWPDKDVPYFCSSFVHFHSKVKDAKTAYDGPLVVHCSAGIGRTGTFIAVDYLVDQAEKHGYVHVSDCVKSLRNQRVNMVQTKKQYKFVHLALVEILTMKTSAVSTATFEETYQELLSVDNAKEKRGLDLEFETLRQMLPVDDEHPANDAKDCGTKSQNRYSNILPFKAFMPSLSQPGLYLFGEFINAAFLPMYKEDNYLIITQSPLETTIEDFWNMVLHQGVHTIVMMNHVTELKETEKYWPKLKEQKTCYENFFIDNKNVEKKRGHTIVTLTITTEKEEKDIQLIQFEKWDKGQTVPEDASQILSALELMEENQRQSGNHPVIVHCMDGVEKSGLFCVMAAVLDRLKVGQEVAISQVIQEMRNRRQNVIPTVTQFQFCHEVVLAFLKQYDTYSNFEFQP